MRNNNSTIQKNKNAKKLVIIGALGGISIFLGISGLGLIRTPLFSLTIMHIPVIIGALIEGPKVGIAVGLIFGLFSMYQNFVTPTITSFIFWNPIIALIPRILIAIVAYYTFTFLKNKIKSQKLNIAIASALATLTNTALVLSFTYIFYLERYAEATNISKEAVSGALFAIAFTNGIPEIIASIFIAVPIVTTILKIKK